MGTSFVHIFYEYPFAFWGIVDDYDTNSNKSDEDIRGLLGFRRRTNYFKELDSRWAFTGLQELILNSVAFCSLFLFRVLQNLPKTDLFFIHILNLCAVKEFHSDHWFFKKKRALIVFPKLTKKIRIKILKNCFICCAFYKYMKYLLHVISSYGWQYLIAYQRNFS